MTTPPSTSSGQGARNGYRPVFEYMDAHAVAALPPWLLELLLPLEVAVSDKLSLKIAWVGEWWFSLLQGHGTVHVRGNVTRDYCQLLLTFSGQNRPKAIGDVLPRPGEMILYEWKERGDLVSSGDFRYCIAHIPKADLLCAAKEGQSLPVGHRVSALMGLGAIVSNIVRTLMNETATPIGRGHIEDGLPCIADLIMQTFATEVDTSHEPFHSHDQTGRILDFMDANLSDPHLSAPQVARASGVSTRQLFRIFEKGGSSYTETLRKARLEKARDLMVEKPAMPLGRIAAACGFSGPSTFSRAFSRHFDRSPAQFRRMERQDQKY